MMSTKSTTSTPTPSVEAIAEQIGVDLASEPNLLPIVSSMQNTPLPPTWTAAAIAQRSSGASSLGAPNDDDTADGLSPCQPLLIEYVNRTTGERTCRHPGARYFSGVVDRARKRSSQITGEKANGSALAPEQYGRSTCGDREAVRAGGGTLVAGGAHGPSRGEDAELRTAATEKPTETRSGTENTVARKHASIRFETATGAFEVEVEDIPAVFAVSHATGRYGKVEAIDLFVGAQLNILGRNMRLMQCDGPTARWLEGEVRAITKAKAALVAALEIEGEHVRCLSDRLELSASAQRGGGLAAGHAAEMDRRCLLQDVIVLRDMLAEIQPEQAWRFARGLL